MGPDVRWWRRRFGVSWRSSGDGGGGGGWWLVVVMLRSVAVRSLQPASETLNLQQQQHFEICCPPSHVCRLVVHGWVNQYPKYIEELHSM